MDSRAAIKLGLQTSEMISNSYLNDLADADLLVRPLPGTNHIAWQLGHLIVAEHDMLTAVRPGSMPDLPEGFRQRHVKETAASDDPNTFLAKAKYLELAKAQREATCQLLDTLSDEQLDQPAPEALRSFLSTVGAVFSMQGSHWLMHAGQWAIIRRKLGRPPLF